ncbi:hypothetical protein [Marinobacterium sp. BA1]|uniref:hypothetical protein n=1 Tax=Marinobacterium sp. BA1 TaxID=3138931 RepID=UPI0032E5CD68
MKELTNEELQAIARHACSTEIEEWDLISPGHQEESIQAWISGFKSALALAQKTMCSEAEADLLKHLAEKYDPDSSILECPLCTYEALWDLEATEGGREAFEAAYPDMLKRKRRG